MKYSVHILFSLLTLVSASETLAQADTAKYRTDTTLVPSAEHPGVMDTVFIVTRTEVKLRRVIVVTGPAVKLNSWSIRVSGSGSWLYNNAWQRERENISLSFRSKGGEGFKLGAQLEFRRGWYISPVISYKRMTEQMSFSETKETLAPWSRTVTEVAETYYVETDGVTDTIEITRDRTETGYQVNRDHRENTSSNSYAYGGIEISLGKIFSLGKLSLQPSAGFLYEKVLRANGHLGRLPVSGILSDQAGLRAGLLAGYALTKRCSAFAEVSSRHYFTDFFTPDADVQRKSNGFQLEAGVMFNFRKNAK